jgi:hypothetical protein
MRIKFLVSMAAAQWSAQVNEIREAADFDKGDLKRWVEKGLVEPVKAVRNKAKVKVRQQRG